MRPEDQLTYLYTASQINAGFIKLYLEEHYIPCFIRNDMHSGITAGFGAALPGSETKVFVKKKHFMQARVLLNRYLKEREEQ
ncbi:MAG: DUF2007 domain-containing protein [Bacteroidales bacterium]